MNLDKNKTVWQRTREALQQAGVTGDLEKITRAMHQYVVSERLDVGTSARSVRDPFVYNEGFERGWEEASDSIEHILEHEAMPDNCAHAIRKALNR